MFQKYKTAYNLYLSQFKPSFWSIMLAIILCIGGGASTINFWEAETPEEAVAVGLPPMPDGWESGVFNHGSYYKWPTMEQHPILYVLSLLLTFCSWLYFALCVLSESAARAIKSVDNVT